MISAAIEESLPLKWTSPAILPPCDVKPFLKPSHRPRSYWIVLSTSRNALPSFFFSRANVLSDDALR